MNTTPLKDLMDEIASRGTKRIMKQYTNASTDGWTARVHAYAEANGEEITQIEVCLGVQSVAVIADTWHDGARIDFRVNGIGTDDRSLELMSPTLEQVLQDAIDIDDDLRSLPSYDM